MFLTSLESLRQKPFGFMLAILLFSVSLTILNYGLFTKNVFRYQQEKYVGDKTRDIDIDFSRGFEELYEKPNGEALLKQMYDKEKNSDVFKYCEFYEQFLYIFNYSGPSIFKYGYEDGMEAENVKLKNNGREVPASSIKSIQVSNNCFTKFNIRLLNGRYFSDNDFNFTNKEKVPVLMGYEYKDYFKIGQELECNYIAKNFSLVIVGFLEMDSNIQMGNNNPLYLDRYIIMPSINCNYKPADYEEKLFQIRHYANKTGGFLEIDQDTSVSYIKLILDNMSSECSLNKYDMFTQDVVFFNSFAVSTKQMWDAIMLLGLLLLLFSSIIFIIVFTKAISRNIPVYCSYLLSGARFITIRICILFEAGAIIITSNIISFLLLFTIYGHVFSYRIFTALLSIIIFVITAFIIMKILNKSRLSNYMGRQK